MDDGHEARKRERLRQELLAAKFTNGTVVAMPKSGTRYRLANMHQTSDGPQGTILREVPKVRGKAARRADKKARRERGIW